MPLADLLALYYNSSNRERQEDDDDDEEEDVHSENGHVPLDSIQPEPLPPLSHYEHVTQNGLDISPNHSPLQEDSLEAQNATIPPENQRITRGCMYHLFFSDCRLGITIIHIHNVKKIIVPPHNNFVQSENWVSIMWQWYF